MWIITQDDFEEEGDYQLEEIGSDDDWSSNTYTFKFSEGYNIAFMYYWTSCYFVDLLIFHFFCIIHLLVLNNYGFVLVIWMENFFLWDECL